MKVIGENGIDSRASLRVLHVIGCLGRGGAEHALVAHIAELGRFGVVSEVVALQAPYDLAPSLDLMGVAVHRLDLPHRWGLVPGLPRLQRIVARGGFDIVHTHLFFAELFVGLLPPSAARKVTTFHNMAYDIDSGSPARPLRYVRKGLHRRVLHRFDAFLAVSDAVARHFSGHLGVPLPNVIPNGVDVDRITAMAALTDRERTRAIHGLETDEVVAIVPARLVPEKDHSTLLGALSRMGDDAPTTLLVGDGPLRSEIAAQIDGFRPAGRVRLVPSLSHADLFPLIRACDVFVSSSSTEGLPVAMIEAQAIGIPIVATRVGGVEDIIEDGETGMLVRPGDAAALADGIRTVLADRAISIAFSRKGMSNASQRFDIRVVARQLADSYRATRSAGPPASAERMRPVTS